MVETDVETVDTDLRDLAFERQLSTLRAAILHVRLASVLAVDAARSGEDLVRLEPEANADGQLADPHTVQG
ncbi:hypothetical protein Scani_33220 [Streptomyces caniferus]|uniref:Uncharacterized protein n=1 Tax=Streptomyces caniferus TaxID=285557 RepID=A0A640S8D7_9ACTN|nr:hypothetical protein Scani_33220 [Streptomyces caniferus]